jgi:Pyruvate/2-oxoacid:ferredoxin oxidoreductase delta subunit
MPDIDMIYLQIEFEGVVNSWRKCYETDLYKDKQIAEKTSEDFAIMLYCSHEDIERMRISLSNNPVDYIEYCKTCGIHLK